MWNRGKLVIVGIVGVALVAAGFSTWYHYQNSARAQAFWGTSSTLLIAEAPQVQVLRIGEAREPEDPAPPPAESAEKAPSEASPKEGEAEATTTDGTPPKPTVAEFLGVAWTIAESKPAPQAPGMQNIRKALVVDTTYDWKPNRPFDDPRWQYGVEFNDGRRWATVLFDFATGEVGLTGGKRTLILDAEANREFQKFFAEQFPEAAAAADKAEAASESASPPADERAAPSTEDADKKADEKPAETP